MNLLLEGAEEEGEGGRLQLCRGTRNPPLRQHLGVVCGREHVLELVAHHHLLHRPHPLVEGEGQVDHHHQMDWFHVLGLEME